MDLVAPVRVVIVDDKPTHLMAIANGLTLAGIPCVWHWYNPEENMLVPAPPVGGYPHLRMLFTDLNIREMAGANREAKTLAGTLISDVLQPLVSPNGGPYSVVLWTNVEGPANEVGDIISERIDAEDLDSSDRRRQPLKVTILPKKEFLAGFNNDADKQLSGLLVESAKKADLLRGLVVDASSENTQLRLACAWESRASLAAADTINAVYDAAILEAKAATQNPTDSLQKIFAKIAIEALGKKNAKDEPARALDEGLIDIFVDDMRSSEVNADYEAVVHVALDTPLNTAPPTISMTARSRLNTFLQIEHPLKPSSRITRGVVLEISGTELKNLINSTCKQLIWDEFLCAPDILEKELKELEEAGETDEALKERATFCRKNKTRAENESKILVLEIGADCDHAQRSQRTIRLLCALEVPMDLIQFVRPSNDLRLLKHDALLSLGPWSVDGREVMLMVSVKRFLIQQDWNITPHMKLRYRLRKPLVDMVLHKYSSHSTRAGIISITE